MKLYTYTAERSLPRMALKGMPDGFTLLGDLSLLAELMDEEPSKALVVLEIDASGLDSIMGVSGDTVEQIAEMEARDATSEGKSADEAYSRIYNADVSSIEKAVEVFDEVTNEEIIPASRITVLGRLESLTFPKGIDEPAEVKFKGTPKPLSAFKQPFVSRLLRSIFLPKHKLYGSGKRGRPTMGFISRFLPKHEEVDVSDEPPPDVVGGVPLVWAAGKTFRRGMRGAFGDEAGDAIGQMIAMRTGQEPGKFLGSGAKGAVYALGPGRALKVTMDGNEVQAAVNLIGARHPNLALVHDAFVVSDSQKGAGIIVREAIDTTLDRFDKKVAKDLDGIMDNVLESAQGKISADVTRLQDIDPKVVADEVELMIELLRVDGCEFDQGILLDLADAFRALRHYGILGIDFDSKNIGVIKKPKPRVVIFDYGMTKSPPVEVEVVSPKSLKA